MIADFLGGTAINLDLIVGMNDRFGKGFNIQEDLAGQVHVELHSNPL
jgi:hypothetical protein